MELRVRIRGAAWNLEVVLVQAEYEHLFGADGFVHDQLFIGFHGSSDQGITVWPERAWAYGTAKVKRIDPSGANDERAAVFYLPCKPLGIMEEARPSLLRKPILKSDHRLTITQIPEAWRGPVSLGRLAHVWPDLAARATSAASPHAAPAQQPRNGPDRAASPAASQPHRPQAQVMPPMPLAPESILPAIAGDMPQQDAAFIQLLHAAEAVNRLRRQAGEVRLEVGDDGKLVVLRVFRPGQVMLRDTPAKKE